MAVDTLGSLVTQLRLEAGHSSSASTGVNMRDQLVYILNRVQEELATDYDFPGMTVDRDVELVVSQRYYDYPADLPFDNINRAWLVWNTLYAELRYGIGPAQFALFNSNTGFTSWPVQRWYHHADDNKFELWPVPNQAPPATDTSQSARVRFRGTKTVPVMVGDSDPCVIPKHILLMWSAAEVLAREGSKDAGLKLDKAKEALRRYKVRQSQHKTRPFVMGGGRTNPRSRGRIGIDYVPEGYGSGPGYTNPSDFSDDFSPDFS
jgi:hypothetical protein